MRGVLYNYGFNNSPPLIKSKEIDITGDVGNGETTRGSILILISKISVTLVLFDFLYAGWYTFSIFISTIIVEYSNILYVSTYLGFVLKNMLQVFSSVILLLKWFNETYLFTDRYIVRKSGIINREEHVYELDTIRSIEVDQSWIGRIFNYGNIILETSASGGYHTAILLPNIPNPNKYEQFIKRGLAQNVMFIQKNPT